MNPNPKLPFVYVRAGFMVYEERPAVIYPTGLCILADIMGVPTYFEPKQWTFNKELAVSQGLEELEKQRPERYEEIKQIYLSGGCFIRPGWSQVDLTWGDPTKNHKARNQC